MHIILIALLGFALMGALLLTATSRETSQRAVALIVSLLVIYFITYTSILVLQKQSEAWNYGGNIRPTGVLFSLVSEDIQAGRVEQATMRLDLIIERWQKIGAKPHAYSASDIVTEIRTLHPQE